MRLSFKELWERLALVLFAGLILYPPVALLIKALAAEDASRAQALSVVATAYLTVVLIGITSWYAYSTHRILKSTELSGKVLMEDLLFRIRPILTVGAEGPFVAVDKTFVSFDTKFRVEKNVIRLLSFKVSAMCETHQGRYEVEHYQLAGRAYSEGDGDSLHSKFDAACLKSDNKCNWLCEVIAEFEDYAGFRRYLFRRLPDARTEIRILRTAIV